MAAKGNSIVDILKEQLTCSICLDLFTNPKTLPCLHSFCLQCLEELHVDNDYITCPNCRAETKLPNVLEGVAAFPAARQLITSREAYNLAQKENQITDPEPKCPTHNKPAEYFCEECSLFLCIECKDTNHNQHTNDMICDVYTKYVQELKERLETLKNTKSDATKALDELAKIWEKIVQQNESITQEIHVMEEEMIHESTKQLHGKLKTTIDFKLKVLSEQKQSIEKGIENMEACMKMVQQFLANSNGKKVVTSKVQIVEMMNEAMKTELIPKEKADIQLIKNNKIVRGITNIGDIVFHSSTVLQQCKVKKIQLSNFLFPLSLECPDSSLLTVPVSSIKCSLVSIGRQPITATVTPTTHPGVYNVHCSALTHGCHQINVQVHGALLKSAPLVIPFNPYLDAITPVHIIDELTWPYGVAVSDDGCHVIVTECGAHNCVTVLDSKGKKVKSFDWEESDNIKISSPHGVAITQDNFIIVADQHCILRVSMDGECIASVGEFGSGRLQFNFPAGIAISPTTGQIYVADRYNHRIQVLYPNLTFSHSFAEDKIRYPWDVAFDSRGLLYALDNGNHRILVYTPEGQSVAEFGKVFYPRGIAIDKFTDLIYVTQHHAAQITVFNCEGDIVTKFGEGMNNAKGLDCSSGHLYICGAIDDNKIVVM